MLYSFFFSEVFGASVFFVSGKPYVIPPYTTCQLEKNKNSSISDDRDGNSSLFLLCVCQVFVVDLERPIISE